MNTICWNCRGLGTPRAVHEVAKLVKKFNPQLLFLSETKKRSSEMEWLRSRWKFDNCFAVDSRGRAGGLAFLWSEDVSVEVKSYSNNHIDVMVGGNNAKRWRFTGFYGNPNVNQRRDSWELLRRLKEESVLMWLCTGDFNEIMGDDEKWGGALRAERQMEDFRSVVDDCGFQALQFLGSQFTWSRGKGEGMIMERLDRGFVNAEWMREFPNTVEQHLVTTHSDHTPILIQVCSNKEESRRYRKQFRFENMWVMNESCDRVVKDEWS